MAKKNIRKTPTRIIEKLKTLSTQVVVGFSRSYTKDEIAMGKFAHLGVVLTEGGLVLPLDGKVLPDEGVGRYSDRNVNGDVLIRRDLPKEEKYNAVESPNWGDSWNGTHTVYLPYQAYPRETIPPRLSEIGVKCLDVRPDLHTYVLAFEVSEVLDQQAEDFSDRLFEALNLMQENTGHCDVQRAGMTMAEYARALSLSWEILPPGTLDETVARLFRGKTPTNRDVEVSANRYTALMQLKPEKLIYGTSGLHRYFGALINDDLVVFENISYGNAIYVMFEDWRELSQKDRVTLLSGRLGSNFERVIHTKNWEDKIKQIVESRRKKTA